MAENVAHIPPMKPNTEIHTLLAFFLNISFFVLLNFAYLIIHNLSHTDNEQAKEQGELVCRPNNAKKWIKLQLNENYLYY